MIAANLAWCSATPGMVGRKAFCGSVLRKPLYFMCLIHLSFRMPEKSLLIAGVSVMGLKFAGSEGSSSAELFGISLTAATFQADGMLPSMMTLLKKSRRAGWREGHFFRIVYKIQSKGGGAEAGLDLLIT